MWKAHSRQQGAKREKARSPLLPQSLLGGGGWFKLKETGVSSVQRDPDEKYSCGRSREIIRSSGVDGTEREASNFVRNQMSLMPWTLFSQVPRLITRLFRSMCLRCNNSPGRNLAAVFVFSSTPANHQTFPRNVPVVRELP